MDDQLANPLVDPDFWHWDSGRKSSGRGWANHQSVDNLHPGSLAVAKTLPVSVGFIAAARRENVFSTV